MISKGEVSTWRVRERRARETVFIELQTAAARAAAAGYGSTHQEAL